MEIIEMIKAAGGRCVRCGHCCFKFEVLVPDPKDRTKTYRKLEGQKCPYYEVIDSVPTCTINDQKPWECEIFAFPPNQDGECFVGVYMKTR